MNDQRDDNVRLDPVVESVTPVSFSADLPAELTSPDQAALAEMQAEIVDIAHQAQAAAPVAEPGAEFAPFLFVMPKRPRSHNRAGFTTHKGQGVAKNIRKIQKKSKKRNRT